MLRFYVGIIFIPLAFTSRFLSMSTCTPAQQLLGLICSITPSSDILAFLINLGHD
jgi:hypothetical protein